MWVLLPWRPFLSALNKVQEPVKSIVGGFIWYYGDFGGHLEAIVSGTGVFSTGYYLQRMGSWVGEWCQRIGGRTLLFQTFRVGVLQVPKSQGQQKQPFWLLWASARRLQPRHSQQGRRRLQTLTAWSKAAAAEALTAGSQAAADG